MKTAFLPFAEGMEDIVDAWTACPWAAEVVEVEGGYKAFESVDDYETWTKQD